MKELGKVGEDDEGSCNVDLRIAELNTQLVVVTQFLQRCSG